MTNAKNTKTAAAVSAVNVAEFVSAHRTGAATVLDKMRTVSAAVVSGSTNAAISKAFADGVRAENVTLAAAAKKAKVAPVVLTIPNDGFTAAVSQYAAAAQLCRTFKVLDSDACLTAAHRISTGDVAAADRDAWAASYKGKTAATFVAALEELLKDGKAKKAAKTAAAAAAKGAKGHTVKTASADKDSDGEPRDRANAIVAPVSFPQLLAAIDAMLTGAASDKARMSMLAELSKVGRKHLTTVAPVAAPVVPVLSESTIAASAAADTARKADSAALTAANAAKAAKAESIRKDDRIRSQMAAIGL